MPLKHLIRSQAFQEFLEGVREIGELLRAAPSDVEQLRSRKATDLANALYRGSVVLLSSHLERYLESLVVEAIDAINATTPHINSIPEPLRMIQILQPLTNAHETKDITKKINSLKILVADYAWFWDDTRPCNKLHSEALISSFDNPLPERIRKLFRNLDINDVVGRAVALDNSRYRRLIEEKVRELVEKRNSVAHTGMTTYLTRSDVIDYLICSRRLVRGIDTVVGQEVQKITVTWPWEIALSSGII